MKMCFFDKAQYLLKEPIRIKITHFDKPLVVKVFCLHKEVSCKIKETIDGIEITGLPLGSYGISISNKSWSWEGAFDIVKNHHDVIRYGFLTDFSSNDIDSDDVEWMKDLHINAIQFYDWMYRHDDLVPVTKLYDNPLGRHMDIQAVINKINACKKYGIRPFAYGAIYAATKKTYEEHPDWAMYTMDLQPMVFAEWLYYMNISEECGWTTHIINEYQKAIKLGFEGIHMDTYGFPKKVWDYNNKPIDLSNSLVNLIDKTKQAVKKEDSNSGVIFNAVNNWPMESVARSNQDVVYIEVWPPHDTFYDLYTLIRQARFYSNKNVVLAAYMKPFEESSINQAQNALRLTFASISAAGGTQLVFGEYKSILKDSYYVRYAKISDSFCYVVSKYSDFIVRYSSLLYNDGGIDITRTACHGINEDICFVSKKCNFYADAQKDGVWTIIRETNKRISINLINLCGNDNLWNSAKNKPQEINDIQIQLRLDRHIEGIYVASPDYESLQAIRLDYTYIATNQGRIYTIDLPTLEYWATIWIELER